MTVLGGYSEEMNKVLLKIVFILAMVLAASGCLEMVMPEIGQDPEPPSNKVAYDVSIAVFGKSKKIPKSLYVRNASKKKKIDINWMYWLVESKDRKMIVDPGFYSQKTKDKYKVEDYIRPDLLLNEIGLSAGDITDVFISHIHAPSIEAIDLFPNARFYIQSGAFSTARRSIFYGKAKKQNVSVKAIKFLEKVNKSGNLRLMDGTFEVLDGFKVHMHTLHTSFFSYFVANTNKGAVVLPSDLVPLNENIKKHRAIGQSNRYKYIIKVYRNMRRIVKHNKYILPHFDPMIEKQFPARSEHIFAVTK